MRLDPVEYSQRVVLERNGITPGASQPFCLSDAVTISKCHDLDDSAIPGTVESAAVLTEVWAAADFTPHTR